MKNFIFYIDRSFPEVFIILYFTLQSAFCFQILIVTLKLGPEIGKTDVVSFFLEFMKEDLLKFIASATLKI